MALAGSSTAGCLSCASAEAQLHAQLAAMSEIDDDYTDIEHAVAAIPT